MLPCGIRRRVMWQRKAFIALADAGEFFGHMLVSPFETRCTTSPMH